MKKIVVMLVVPVLVSCGSISKNNKGQNVSVTTSEKLEQNTNDASTDMHDSPLFSTEVVEPTKLFDNIYFVGYQGIGAFVINTTDGLILIDAMWTAADAENVIIPGIKKLGLDPLKLKYLIVTHEHADHYGGARYIEDTYHTKILMSKVAWEGIHDPKALVLVDPFGNKSSDLLIPKTYQEINDKEIVSLGKTNIEVLLTPGHTKGAISLLISTTDIGVPHVAAIWGGTGLPETLKDNEEYLKSLNYFEAVAVENNADAQISNHPFSNNLLDKMEKLRVRKSGESNPIIEGTESFKKSINATLRKNATDKIAKFN